MAARSGVLVDFLRNWGAWGIRWLIGAAVIFAAFAMMKFRRLLERVFDEAARVGVPGWCAPVHAGALFAFAFTSRELYGKASSAISSESLVLIWAAGGMIAGIAALWAIAPPAIWIHILKSTGLLYVQAPLGSAAACWLGSSLGSLWRPASKATFYLSSALLRPFIPDLFAIPQDFVLGTPRFSVNISPQCSGLEGMALFLAFGVLWLVLFRKEIRLPQALLLLPIGIVALFVLNAARIAALLWIGDHGAPGVAAGGFHSQAGWLSFNAVALGVCVAAGRIRWFSAMPEARSRDKSARNPVAPFLAPFLLILVAGMLSRATSAGFEWLYPARAILAIAGLWHFHDRYRGLNWRVGWVGPAAGAFVFALWIAGESGIAATTPATGMPAELIGASPLFRLAWIGIRILTAVAVVPIAEELAFRGFALRRLISEDFEAVPIQSFTWLSFMVSSLLFGLLHDSRWVVGTIAGMIFALAMRRTGSIGEAVAAHAVANALLAAYVLYFGAWQLW